MSIPVIIYGFLAVVGSGNLAADTNLVNILIHDRCPKGYEWTAAAFPLTTMFGMLGTVFDIGGNPNKPERTWVDRMNA
jgi:hypothetical protein